MIVVDGAEVWRLKAESGFPLEMALEELAKRGMVPSWSRLFAAAKRDGANLPRLARGIVANMRDVYPADLQANLEERLVPLAEQVKAGTLDLLADLCHPCHVSKHPHMRGG